MPILRLVAALCLALTWPTLGQSALPEAALARISAYFPKVASKLQARQHVHVAFVGDPLLLDPSDHHYFVPTFLRRLETTFFYTGGVHDLYDPEHLDEERPKLTYECRPTETLDPGAFQLMQVVTTVGLLNEPDLVVLVTGPGDALAGIDLETSRRAFEDLRRQIHTSSDLLVIGPRAFRIAEGELVPQLETRALSVVLKAWATSANIPYHDPNPQLFPNRVLFHPNDGPDSIWNAFLTESSDWILGRDPQAAIHARRQQAVGSAVFETLTSSPQESPYTLSAQPGEGLTVTLQQRRRAKLAGLVVPCLSATPSQRFQQEDISFTLETHEVPTLWNQLPLSLIVIDDLRVHWVETMAPLGKIGLEWRHHAVHHNKGLIDIRARLHPYAGAPQQVPYQMRFGEQTRTGTATFLRGEFADVTWQIELPNDHTRVFREDLTIQLGDQGALGTYRRQLDAMRQIPLDKETPLLWVASEGAEKPKNDDPLIVGDPETSLTVEATESELLIHVDLKNFQLIAADDTPSLQLALTLDARSFEEVGTLGHVGTLFITAGPDDGPATISAFAKRAHFGNGYARRPLVPGRQARLSTRPNGVRRLTVHMTKDYFYRLRWIIDNANNPLGLGLSLTIAQEGERPPLRYVLQETPRDPDNAEDLAIIELSPRGTNRWFAKWHP